MVTVKHVSGDMSLTGIVAAMEEEIVGLRARLVDPRPGSVNGAHVTLGSLGASRVAIAVTGDGERNARRGLAALLAAFPARRIVVAGVAGGLSPSLGLGALVLAEQVLAEDEGELHAADAALLDVVSRIGGAQRGVVVSAGRIADTVAEKRRLLALAGTRVAPAAAAADLRAVVDLESAAFVAVAARMGVPWIVLRAVSDTATESVPAILNRSRDEGGAVRRGSVVRGLLGNPGALLPLLALRERVRTCAGVLADAVELTVVALGALDAASAAVTYGKSDPEDRPLPREVLNGV